MLNIKAIAIRASLFSAASAAGALLPFTNIPLGTAALFGAARSIIVDLTSEARRSLLPIQNVMVRRVVAISTIAVAAIGLGLAMPAAGFQISVLGAGYLTAFSWPTLWIVLRLLSGGPQRSSASPA